MQRMSSKKIDILIMNFIYNTEQKSITEYNDSSITLRKGNY